MQGSLPTKRDLIENSSTSCLGNNQLEVTVKVSTDQFGFENKFEIKDMISGTVIVSKLLEASTNPLIDTAFTAVDINSPCLMNMAMVSMMDMAIS